MPTVKTTAGAAPQLRNTSVGSVILPPPAPVVVQRTPQLEGHIGAQTAQQAQQEQQIGNVQAAVDTSTDAG